MYLIIYLIDFLYHNQRLHILSFFIIFLFIFLRLYSRYFIFKKTDRDPYMAFIPLVSSYQLYDVSWYGFIGIIVLVLEIITSIHQPEGNLLTIGFIGYLYVAFYVLKSTLQVIFNFKLCKSLNVDITYAIGLIFAEDIFMFYLGLNKKTEYLGKTLRKYNLQHEVLRKKTSTTTNGNIGRKYAVSLYKWRSATALIASVIVCGCTLYAISEVLISKAVEGYDDVFEETFKFFTINSNIFSALAASFIIPYAAEGIRKRIFRLPKWVSLIQLSAVLCTTITMFFSLFFILPGKGVQAAFGGDYFYLHGLCPLLALILLFLVEADNRFSLEDTFICLLPFALYALVYTTRVVLIGEQAGGWSDFYGLNTYLPASVTAPMMFVLGFTVASLTRLFYNKLNDYRHEITLRNLPKNASPVEIKIEAFGLGRLYGSHVDKNSIPFPIDLLLMFSEKYNIELDDLVKAYSKGVSDAIKDKQEFERIKQERLKNIFGIPEKLSKEITIE